MFKITWMVLVVVLAEGSRQVAGATESDTQCWNCHVEFDGSTVTGPTTCVWPLGITTSTCDGPYCVKIIYGDASVSEGAKAFLTRSCATSCTAEELSDEGAPQEISQYGTGKKFCCQGDKCNPASVLQVTTSLIAMLPLAVYFLVMQQRK